MGAVLLPGIVEMVSVSLRYSVGASNKNTESLQREAAGAVSFMNHSCPLGILFCTFPLGAGLQTAKHCFFCMIMEALK